MIQTQFQDAAAPLFAEILEEISSQDWLSPVHVVIDELGLAMGSHLGLKRRRNEDRIAAARIQAKSGESYTVALVCDGVGSSESGDRAAAIAISSVISQLATQQHQSPLGDLAKILVRGADDQVRQELIGRGTTTLVMLLADASGELVCTSVGDSRAYSWDPAGGKFKQVTVDDTIENELKELPGNHSALLQARGLQGRLSQAVGEVGRGSDELRVTTYSQEHFRSGAVISSDGLWRLAHDFEKVVANAKTATDVVRRSIALANWVGGVDNASLIALESPELFFRKRTGNPSSIKPGITITLWTSGAKIRILPQTISENQTKAPARQKFPKPKKTIKGKADPTAREQPQLKLEPLHPSENRPKIEVTISDNHKKPE